MLVSCIHIIHVESYARLVELDNNVSAHITTVINACSMRETQQAVATSTCKLKCSSGFVCIYSQSEYIQAFLDSKIYIHICLCSVVS